MVTSGRGGRRRGVLRWFAIAVIGAVVLAACAVGDDDDDATDTTTTETTAEPDSDRGDLPITYAEAEAEGTVDDYDWGDDCDPETGRVKISLATAAPCVPVFAEGDDNGGETSEGVTADAIKVAVYVGQPDPLQQAVVQGEGGTADPEITHDVLVDYIRMFEDLYETYGREIEIVRVDATGGAFDAVAAKADGIRVAEEIKPFGAIGGPAQTPAYWQELAKAGVVCLGLTCSLAETTPVVQENAPYLWPNGPTPNQADQLFLEMVGKQLVGKNAEFAGDEAMHDQERVFGWIQAETEAGEYAPRNDAFEEGLKEYGGEIAERQSYVFDLAKAQEIARTIIPKMKSAGVTTVIVSTDPFLPDALTQEATAQDYWPEWVIGPTVLVDTNFFGRTFDQEQWSHAFGISLPATPTSREISDSYTVYDWYYGKPPPATTQAVIIPGPWQLLTGIHMAGPNLTPETFRDGMFRFPAPDPAPTRAYATWGEGLWPDTDYNGGDDAGLIWWDPDIEGETEVGAQGKGLYRFVDGGTRHLLGEFPEEPVPWFDPEGTATIYEERPPEDDPPDYPPPQR